MQHGTRRRRSDSSDEIPNSKRHRISPTSPEAASSAMMSNIRATESVAGPSAPSALNALLYDREILPLVPPISSSMYADDKDWTADDEDDVYVDDDGVASIVKRTGRQSLMGTKRRPVDREEITRLMLQTLRDLGHDKSADMLETESGCVLASQSALEFQEAILGARWAEALALLPHLGVTTPTDSASVSSIVLEKRPEPLGQITPVESVRFLISRQKYLELLEVGGQRRALAVLRHELTPVVRDAEDLHWLSGDREELYDRARWDGAAGTSRRRLLEQIQTFMSPKVLLPPRRLATLLDQARAYQQQFCRYHTDAAASSLYTDHHCKSGSFPSDTTHILADHGDEVHNLVWSPDGELLATAGHDRMVVIWQLKTMVTSGETAYDMQPLHQLRDHRESVGALAWSPDCSLLVTAADRTVYMWDVKKPMPAGAGQHTDEISAIRWMPDGSEFLVSSMDCKLIFYSANGEMKRQWSTPTLQFRDFAITLDGQRLIAATAHIRRHLDDPKPKPSMSGRPSHDPINGIVGTVVEDFGYEEMDHGIVVVGLANKRIESVIPVLGSGISSITLSGDGKRFLIAVEDEDIMLYSTEPDVRFMRRFTGHSHSRFLIRSCFGPPKDRYVLSGSEDSNIYVWDANSGKAIGILQGHQDSVNAVAWNPVVSRRLFASCSDDKSVRIWQPPTTLREQGEVLMEAVGNGEEVNEGEATEGAEAVDAMDGGLEL